MSVWLLVYTLGSAGNTATLSKQPFISSPHRLGLAGLTDLPLPHISGCLVGGAILLLCRLERTKSSTPLNSPPTSGKTLWVLLTLSFSSSANLPRFSETLALDEQKAERLASFLPKQQNLKLTAQWEWGEESERP